MEEEGEGKGAWGVVGGGGGGLGGSPSEGLRGWGGRAGEGRGEGMAGGVRENYEV